MTIGAQLFQLCGCCGFRGILGENRLQFGLALAVLSGRQQSEPGSDTVISADELATVGSKPVAVDDSVVVPPPLPLTASNATPPDKTVRGDSDRFTPISTVTGLVADSAVVVNTPNAVSLLVTVTVSGPSALTSCRCDTTPDVLVENVRIRNSLSAASVLVAVSKPK